MAPRAGRAWKHSGSDGACKGQNLEMWTNSVPSRGRVGISEVTLDDISFHSVPTGSRRSEGVQTHTAEEQAPIRSPLAPLHSIAGQERARANSVSGCLAVWRGGQEGLDRRQGGGGPIKSRLPRCAQFSLISNRSSIPPSSLFSTLFPPYALLPTQHTLTNETTSSLSDGRTRRPTSPSSTRDRPGDNDDIESGLTVVTLAPWRYSPWAGKSPTMSLALRRLRSWSGCSWPPADYSLATTQGEQNR